jgi:NAD(P)-dependent dehydrogenase (short-subunit alcohol dehydrogenase family)
LITPALEVRLSKLKLWPFAALHVSCLAPTQLDAANFPRDGLRQIRKLDSANPIERYQHLADRLDIAVNNAGTVGNPGSAADVTTEAYQSIFDTNREFECGISQSVDEFIERELIAKQRHESGGSTPQRARDVSIASHIDWREHKSQACHHHDPLVS